MIQVSAEKAMQFEIRHFLCGRCSLTCCMEVTKNRKSIEDWDVDLKVCCFFWDGFFSDMFVLVRYLAIPE